MDTLEFEQRNILLKLGNNIVNSIFLVNLPKSGQSSAFGIDKDSDRFFNKIFQKLKKIF